VDDALAAGAARVASVLTSSLLEALANEVGVGATEAAEPGAAAGRR
jgi:hypothetical protein